VATDVDLDIEGTELLERTLDSTKKIVVHKGSSGSSKTMSLAQGFIMLSFEEVGKTYSVVRKTMPALRRGALKDFNDALDLAEARSFFRWNERDLTFTNRQTGTRIEFFSLDDSQKARGPRRWRLWCNEGNELSYEEWRQLTMRTKSSIWLDYNPSMLKHWIYDKVETRIDCEVISSTYLINPFLTEDNIREIEIDVPVYQLTPEELRAQARRPMLSSRDMQHLALAGLPPSESLFVDWKGEYTGKNQPLVGDAFRWSVFGLGRRGAPTEAIYPQVFDSAGLSPNRVRRLGLDFGFNHPTVLVDLEYREMPGKAELHIDELIFMDGLTSDDLVTMLPQVGVTKRDAIEADGARPEMIEAIKRAGYNIKAADKGPGSVKAGIDKLKTVKLCFTKRSAQSKEQFQDYRWRSTSSGQILEEPVKHEDDAPDAVRYGALNLIKDRTAPKRRSAPSALIQ
jgi:phage terminase large subunit